MGFAGKQPKMGRGEEVPCSSLIQSLQPSRNKKREKKKKGRDRLSFFISLSGEGRPFASQERRWGKKREGGKTRRRFLLTFRILSDTKNVPFSPISAEKGGGRGREISLPAQLTASEEGSFAG